MNESTTPPDDGALAPPTVQAPPDQQLPAAFEPLSDFGYEQEAERRTPILKLIPKDENAGQWTLQGMVLGNAIDMLFVSRRYHRTLWAKSYEDLADGEENLIVCRSFNGDEAFGLGRLPDLSASDEINEDWRSQCASRVCRAKGRNVCPAAESFTCRPEIRALVLVRWQGGPDVWVPCFFEAKGMAFRQVDDAYAEGMRRMRFSAKFVDSKLVPSVWLWQWRFRVGTSKTPGRKSVFVPQFQPPTPLTDDGALPLRTIADQWVRQYGSAIWRGDIEHARQAMLLTGQAVEEADTEEGEAKPSSRRTPKRDGPPPDDPAWNPDEIPF